VVKIGALFSQNNGAQSGQNCQIIIGALFSQNNGALSGQNCQIIIGALFSQNNGALSGQIITGDLLSQVKPCLFPYHLPSIC
jgi:hypothetical protein